MPNPIFTDIFDGNLLDNNTTTGTSLDDIILGDNGNDVLIGSLGNDLLYGNSGNDTINGGDGNDTIDGGDGNDTIDGGFGLDVMDGGAGIDTLNVTFFAGDYVLNMTTGVTNFVGETAINFENVNTGAGNDSITGNISNNIINTGAGNDTINGGDGNDTINGGDGNDTIDGGFGLDVMDGGAGIDTLNVTFFAGDYVLNMTTGVTNFVGETAINFENVNTGAGNDSITGNISNNIINTGAGNDTINGGDGNDTLIGGLGTDTMTDGIGNDIYKFFATAESQVGVARDLLIDFTSGTDKIDLSSIDADISLAGDQAFTFIGSSAFNGSGPQVRFFTSGGNLFLQAEINGDLNSTADMEIQVNGLTSILASDIIL